MKLSAVRAGVLFVSITLLGWSTAHASLVLEVLRVDNSNAQIAGTGVLDVNAADFWLSLNGATSTGDKGYDSFSGTLAIGGNSPFNVYTRKLTNDFWLDFSSSTPRLQAGDAITGLMMATLDVETWAPVGTTGIISDGSTTLGSYTIVSSFSAVPVPAAAWLFGSGLLGLIGIAKRKKA